MAAVELPKILLLVALCFGHTVCESVSRLPHSPFPVSSRPIGDVWVANLTATSYDVRMLFQSLAGVLAQDSPALYLLDENDAPGGGPTGRGAGGPTGSMSRFQLELLPIQPNFSLCNSLAALVQRLGGGVKGFIEYAMPPPSAADNGSLHVAISLAGVLGGVLVTDGTTAAWARAAGLTRLLDARTLSLDDAFAQYESQFSQTILYNQQVLNLVHTTDYAIFTRAFSLYDAELTMPLSQHALARLQPISMVLGWGSELDIVTSASRFGHAVICSDAVSNLPLFSNFPARTDLPAQPAPSSTCPLDPNKHTVAFMFTDGDSLTWDLGQFASPSQDWFGSPLRGHLPLAWTFQPMLAELHPHYLHWVLAQATANDTFIGGPSGAGYTYLDQYPTAAARARFAEWTSASMGLAGLTNMINQIQVGVYNSTLEEETVGQPGPPRALFVDEYLRLTLHGSSLVLRDTLVTSRRHCLATWGDVTPATLPAILNAATTNASSGAGYSVIGVEVWSYRMADIVSIQAQLDPSRVQVASLGDYVACLRQRVFPTPEPPKRRV